MNIYVASSWRNKSLQQACVQALRVDGHEVYDFMNPEPGDYGFSWRQLGLDAMVPSDEGDDRAWLRDPERFREGLKHPIAQRGFGLDMDALRRCDACVLVLPCGRSAHLELGWAAGAGKISIVLLDQPLSEPELMYLACTKICVDLEEVVDALRVRRVPLRKVAPSRLATLGRDGVAVRRRRVRAWDSSWGWTRTRSAQRLGSARSQAQGILARGHRYRPMRVWRLRCFLFS